MDRVFAFFRRSRCLIALVVIVLLVFFGWPWFKAFNPTPSDEELIDFFYENRPAIEALVDFYRKGGEIPSKEWNVLRRKSGVGHVGTTGLWIGDDPYVDGKPAFDKYLKLPASERIKKSRALSGLSVIPADKRYMNILFSVSKELFHIPKPVKIEGGRLVFPEHTGRGGEDTYRLLPSLNKFPDPWKDGDCVFRQIESEWFISMCHLSI
ncbi:hypothetical protein [Pseudomonas aeruginosa]|uniref:hypothetical protein n=1 Tax=Pseudomonas aeruginosa TaxID=287 RepID=UPI002A754B1A|nr:hypothetical protein [Pseudomonas aeruginosa]MDY1584109.1 hypothetical protein [Pseudomonas aeruginosa]